MTSQDLAVWMRKHGYVDDIGRLASSRLARDLGVHRSTIMKWLAEENPIDTRTELALERLSQRTDARRAARQYEGVV